MRAEYTAAGIIGLLGATALELGGVIGRDGTFGVSAAAACADAPALPGALRQAQRRSSNGTCRANALPRLGSCHDGTAGGAGSVAAAPSQATACAARRTAPPCRSASAWTAPPGLMALRCNVSVEPFRFEADNARYGA